MKRMFLVAMLFSSLGLCASAKGSGADADDNSSSLDETKKGDDLTDNYSVNKKGNNSSLDKDKPSFATNCAKKARNNLRNNQGKIAAAVLVVGGTILYTKPSVRQSVNPLLRGSDAVNGVHRSESKNKVVQVLNTGVTVAIPGCFGVKVTAATVVTTVVLAKAATVAGKALSNYFDDSVAS